MFITNVPSPLQYDPPADTKTTMDGINKQLATYSKKLESLGFSVKRKKQSFFFTPGQTLIATRGEATLNISMDISGYQSIAASLGNKEVFSPLVYHSTDFSQALTSLGFNEFPAALCG